MGSDIDISNLKKCIDSLEICQSALQKNQDSLMSEFIEDSCIQRYEFTVETAWKLMKRYLKIVYGKNDNELTVNNIFRYMAGYGFIQSWERWREYYQKRNDTSHEYNREKALDVLNYVEPLLNDSKFLYDKLFSEIEKNQ